MGKLGDIMALVGVVFGSSCAYATADASVGETFSGDGLSDTLVGASEGSTTDPDISTGIALVAPSLSVTVGSSAEPEIIGIIFRKMRFHIQEWKKKLQIYKIFLKLKVVLLIKKQHLSQRLKKDMNY